MILAGAWGAGRILAGACGAGVSLYGRLGLRQNLTWVLRALARQSQGKN